MTLVACVDDGMGLLFHGRRQSQDRILREKLLEMVDTHLNMSLYSGRLFGQHQKITAQDSYLEQSASDDWIFAEDLAYLSRADGFDRLILFRWNRAYPSDVRFVFPGQWRLVSREDFAGSSHPNITMEVYQP